MLLDTVETEPRAPQMLSKYFTPELHLQILSLRFILQKGLTKLPRLSLDF